MVDPAKDYYNERLAQAAWSLGSSVAFPGPGHPGLADNSSVSHGHLHPSSVHGHGASAYGSPSNYLHSAHGQIGFDMSKSRVPNGGQNSVHHSFMYPGNEQYHQPLPAHTSVVRSGSVPSPIAGPLPAHMRSNPYQASPYSQLNPSYNHFSQPYGYPSLHGAPIIQEKSHSDPSSHNGNNSYYPNPNHPKDFSRARQSSGNDSSDTTINLSSHSAKSINSNDNSQPPQGYNTLPGFAYHQAASYQNYYCNPASFLNLGNPYSNRPASEKNQSISSQQVAHHLSQNELLKSNQQVDGATRGLTLHDSMQGTPSGILSLHQSGTGSLSTPKSSYIQQGSALTNSESTKSMQERVKPVTSQASFNEFYQPSTSQSQASLPTTQNCQPSSSEPVSFVNASSPLPSGPKNMSLKRPASVKASGSEFKQKYFKRDGQNTHKDGSFDATDDPYAFDDDDTNASNQSSGSLDFSRKSCNSPSGPVYKFKNALLTRTSENGPQGSPSSSKSMNLDSSLEAFSLTCDKLIDDLNTKPISVSRRHSLELWQATMAAKAAQKEKRKEKKGAKSEDSQNAPVLQNHGSSEDLSPVPSDLSQLEKSQIKPEPKQDDFDKVPEAKKPEILNGESETLFGSHTKGPNSGVLDAIVDVVSKDAKTMPQNTSQNSPGSIKLEEGSKPISNITPQQNKKGALWALPIVPKPPQKQTEKRLVGLPLKKPDTPRVASDASGSAGPAQGGSATEIWLQAFGVSKPKKPVEISQTPGKQAKTEIEIPVSSQRNDLKTILDIPPELRRRPKPNFGGLIYFSPDWEREVLRFHEKQRVPNVLAKNIIAKPKFLMNSQPLGTSSLSPPAEFNRPATPPNRPAINLMSLSPNGSDDMPLQTFGLSSSESLPSSSKNVMETILENRKKLRNSITMGRMFRMPAVPEKKRYNSKGTSSQPADPSRKQDVSGLLPTPGMPLWVDSDNHEEEDLSLSMANPFGNFRRETILRYLGDVNPDLRTKLLDWKPEIYETKTRRQSSQARSTLSLGDIFGEVGDSISEEKPTPCRNDSITAAAKSSSDDEIESALSSPITSPAKSSKSSPVSIKKRTYKKRSISQIVVKEEIDSDGEKQQPKQIDHSDIKTENFLVPKLEGEFQEPLVKKRGRKKLYDTPPRLGRPPKIKPDGQIQNEKQMKVEQSSDVVKPKRGRKPKNTLPVNSSSSAETDNKLIFDEHKEFSSGGPASGAFAAVALAIDTAKERALEKEKPAYKRLPKKVKIKMELEVSDVDDYVPNEEEEKLQLELQNFAQELLDENKSWDRRKVIQNLVIWEFIPVDPSLLPPPLPVVDQAQLPPPIAVPLKRRPKKGRKNPSGLDFAKKKTTGKNSRGVSRAASPDPGGVGAEAHDISYTLDHLLAEINRWVIDKSAGETILHRAAKMGYPDAVAYALGMAKMNPKTKDNAGYPPIHKAAYRKHCEIVNMLLRFGADPNANVKGTRPLHEAIDGDSLACVHHLLSFGADPALYDYSGNTPIDLTEDSEEMHFYFTNILADIEGKPGSRWNVSHCEDFHMPPDDLECEDYVTQEPAFEIVQDIFPPMYKLNDRAGKFMLSFDLVKYLKADDLNKLPITPDTVEISREEFLRHAVCSDLGCSPSLDIMTLDKVKLIQIDANLKKFLGATKSA